MNSQQLAVFYEVMKTGSVSEAARNLLRTQPAVSAAIKGLERELGLELFRREGRRMVPVPEALYLLDEATEILSRLEAAQQNMTNMRDQNSGALRIAAMPGPSSFLLPDFISQFVADRPKVRVSLLTRSSPQVRAMMATGSYDLGFADASGHGVNQNLYFSEEMPGRCLCAVPQNHRLAKKDSISIADLDGEPMGALQPGHSTYIETVRAFTRERADFNLRFDAQFFLPLFHFVEAGQACAIVDPLSAESYLRSRGADSKILFLPLQSEIDMWYSVLFPKNRPLSQLAQSFQQEWWEFVTHLLQVKFSQG
ncbi:LysR family transcriptional regulator [Halocynthiibacter styelae]|uniref:LysR family transcriptional regulator n=1 Tax=Halocynthiibacter styelae TaxID=2761955 RepID=A0A8J7IQ43_9RHOB|nr:LysR substrate-binding domain-containing protein [Paenihalocynthiibacter styelae]MBI1495091.1 LysR family transcriptional regulator [Paenihalocynthiibacter styelae]